MFRTLTRRFLWSATLIVLAGLPHFALAEMPPDAYSSICLQVRVTDRQNLPVAGLPVRITADLNGIVLEDDHRSEGVLTSLTRVVPTDASGLATLHLSGSPWTHAAEWYRGRVTVAAFLINAPHREISPLGADTVTETRDFPETEALPPLALQIYEEADRQVEGFPVWTARDGRLDKIVVVLEGFDLYNRVSATDLMQILTPVSDALRRQGISILVVHFPDSHLAPDRLAPRAADAIQAAAKASGHPVVVVGLSGGRDHCSLGLSPCRGAENTAAGQHISEHGLSQPGGTDEPADSGHCPALRPEGRQRGAFL